jgi:hypothetical protein
VSDPNLVQILFDGVTPKAVVAALLKAAEMIGDNPSDLSQAIKWP